ncbi:unnamed protein product [Rotaria sordida]|uniref:NAD(P)(+)--arginine ADP-ribosyltransferase n=1 Tax=Rotaria sordida TaxID=392033 RepID=A0A813MV07_9BILA|nr:unnamed protein product [Rotaria sordida]CAF1219457.1 unnamed protein product [Rotaria sordida]
MTEKDVSNVDVNFVVIWLDQDVNKKQENEDTKALLRHAVGNQLKTFDNPDQCIDYITTESMKLVFLIVSNAFGHYLVPMIYQLPQIQAIYVFCVKRQRAEIWVKPHFKISGIFTSKKILVNKVRDDIDACNVNIHIPISIFHIDDRQKIIGDLKEDSAKFMWYQLLIIVLQRLPISKHSKDDMISECRIVYRTDQVEKDKINRFEQEYTESNAIWWYTYDCFVYRLLNKALRTQNIDIIFRFRFFIHDLNNQIKQLYLKYLQDHHPLSEHRLTVYRGQHLNIDEVNVLLRNVSGLVSMNTFLSATLNIDIALIYAETDSKSAEISQTQSVLFIIDIFDMSEETTPFAPIAGNSCNAEEEEVLFTIGAIFKVISVEKKDDRWEIHLQLSQEENKLYRDLSYHIMRQIGSEANSLALGWFLYRMNDFNKAERYAQSLLKQLSNNDKDTGNAYNLLGLIHKDTGRLPQAIEYYQKALENYSYTSSPNNPQVIATHYNLGLAYLATGNKQQAAEHQAKATGRLTNSSQTNNPLLVAMTVGLKAKLDTANGNYVRAFKSLEKVLQTKKNSLPSGHPSFASTLKEMGIVQLKMNNHEKALEYLNEALDICCKSLTEYNIDTADCHENIAHVHYKRQEYSLALEHFEKALDTVTYVSREDVDRVDDLQKWVANTIQMMSHQKKN